MFFIEANLFNLHLIAIPFECSHTGDNMFNGVKQVLDALCSDWRDRLIGITTDGAMNMVGKFRGLATNLQHSVTNKSDFYRVWCGAHQLYLVVKISKTSFR